MKKFLNTKTGFILGVIAVVIIGYLVVKAFDPQTGNNTDLTTVATKATAQTTESQPETPTKGSETRTETSTESENPQIDENGTYDSKEDVALYLHIYRHLPSNYVTKKEAEKYGWSGGSVEQVLPGFCIGGDYYGNYEKRLPENEKYHECDIDTLDYKDRGSRRIVYSESGAIYYTGDHYKTFTKLYDSWK